MHAILFQLVMAELENNKMSFKDVTGYEWHSWEDYRRRLAELARAHSAQLSEDDLKLAEIFTDFKTVDADFMYAGLAYFNQKFFSLGANPLDLELDEQYAAARQKGPPDFLERMRKFGIIASSDAG